MAEVSTCSSFVSLGPNANLTSSSMVSTHPASPTDLNIATMHPSAPEQTSEMIEPEEEQPTDLTSPTSLALSESRLGDREVITASPMTVDASLIGSLKRLQNTPRPPSSPSSVSIRYKAHSGALSQALVVLLSECYGTDVHLKCDHIHDTIRAHRVVLAAFSPLFKSLLTELPTGTAFPVIMLPSIRHDTLASIVNFCYKGEIELADNKFDEFVKAAKTLQIEGADEFCNEAVRKSSGPFTWLTAPSSLKYTCTSSSYESSDDDYDEPEIISVQSQQLLPIDLKLDHSMDVSTKVPNDESVTENISELSTETKHPKRKFLQHKRHLISNQSQVSDNEDVITKRACLFSESLLKQHPRDILDGYESDSESVKIDVDDEFTESERAQNNASNESFGTSLQSHPLLNVEDCLRREFCEGEQNLSLKALENNNNTNNNKLDVAPSSPNANASLSPIDKEAAEYDLKKYYFLEQLKQAQNIPDLSDGKPVTSMNHNNGNSFAVAAAAAARFQLMSQVLNKIRAQDAAAALSTNVGGTAPDNNNFFESSNGGSGVSKSSSSLTDATARAIAASTFASLQQQNAFSDGHDGGHESPFSAFSGFQSSACATESQNGRSPAHPDVSSFLAAANYLNSGNLNSKFFLPTGVTSNNSSQNNSGSNSAAEKRGRGRPPKYGTLFPGQQQSNPIVVPVTTSPSTTHTQPSLSQHRHTPNNSVTPELKLKISSSSSSSSQSSSPAAVNGHAAAATALKALANSNTGVINTNRSRRGRPPSVPDENFRSVSSGRTDKPHHKCPHCPQIYYGYHAMRDHITSVHLNSGEKYTCHLCNKEYTWRITLRKHLKCQHGVHPDQMHAKA